MQNPLTSILLSKRNFRWAGLLLICLLAMTQTTLAQLTGVKTIPGDYATVAAAVADLNTQGVGAGGVTFNVAAGHTETIAATISLTATGTMADPIVFQKSGAGANPVITSYTGGTATPGSATQDGIWRLVGSDYVTIDAIDLAENSANTTNPSTMEYGYSLYKSSATDGCQNVTIKNCKISLNRVNNAAGSGPSVDGSRGIEMVNAIPTVATTALTVTAASGSNSNNKFYSNTIQNCNIGIALIGYAAPSPFTLADTGNDVGGSSAATGNVIKNFGGGGTTSPAAGVRTLAQYNLNVSYNTIDNNDGGGITHASTLRGIFLNTATSASATVSHNTVTLRGGGTTSTCSGIDNASGSTAASNTINITNNTVNIAYTSATSGVMNGIINSGTAATVNINDNTIQGISGSPLAGTGTHVMIETGSPTTVNTNNNTIQNLQRSGASGSWRGIKTTSPTNWTCNNNLITGLSWTTATSTGGIDAIYSFSSAVNVTITNNVIHTLSTPTTGTMNGIREFGVSGTKTIRNNQIYNFSTTSGGAGGFTGNGIFCSTGNIEISSNLIHSINNTGTTGGTGGTIFGIQVSGGTTNSVFKNKIYNLSSNSTNPIVAGIRVSSSTTMDIYNNLIGELNTPFANAANPLIGIDITGGTTVNAHFNTVFIQGASAGALFGSSAISASTTPTLTLRNNIFVNLSAPNGTGLSVAYRRSTTTLTSYGAASNNNLFHAGTPGPANLIFYDGTNADQTLAAYKTRVAPRDAASIDPSPVFLSTSGSSTNFLHIDPAIPTQIESGGTPITGITDDYDGDSRNATTPDIGADEFTGTPVDLTPPTIVYTPLANTCNTGARTLTATITDASGVPTSGIGLPVLYWSINSATGPFNASTATSLGSGQYEFSLGAGSMSGDVIHYYVVAQDGNTPTPNVGSFPSAGAGGFTPNPPAAATPPTTPSSYTNLVVLSGTKTVGVGGDYTTLTAAVADYNNRCINGPVVFNLIDATYPSEMFPIVINENPGASATNTLTIKPANGVTATISGTSTSCIIRLNGADYVTIDGSNSGGTDRSLTLENTSTSTNTAVVCVSSLGTGLGATNDVIKNCNIMAGANGASSATFGIHVAGTTISTSATGNDNDNLTIQNNAISKAAFGIYAQASSTGVNDNLMIIQNAIGSGTAANYVTNRGILFSQATNTTVSENTIFNMIVSSISSTLRAIESGTGVTNTVISRNNIFEISNTGTSVFRAGQGISLNTGATGANVTVANNMIAALKGDGSSTATNNSWGIMLLGGGDYNVYYNSVHIPDNRLTTSSADLHGGIYIASTVTGLELKNNIFSVTGNAGNATNGKMYAVYSLAASPFTTSNNNDLYASGTRHFTGLIGGTDRTTLADWQAGSGQDANSVSIPPVFLSATDLHLNTGSNPSLDGAAMPVSVTVDFDGQSRNATTPDIGADEFTPPPCTGAVGGAATPSGMTTFCASGSATITATGYSTGSGSTYLWEKSTDNFVNNIESTGQTNPASFNTGTLTVTTYFRLKVTCSTNASTDFSNVVTITITPSVANISPANPSICVGESVTLTENGGTGTSWLWAPGGATSSSIMVSPASTTTYTVTVTSPGPCTATASVTVTVNPAPANPMASASDLAVCPDAPFNLFSSADPTNANILSQNFESGLGAWTTVNNSTGGTPAAAAWTLRNSPYDYNGDIFSSNDASQFIMSNSDAQGNGGTTATLMQSPAFSTVGYSNVTLTFFHHYEDIGDTGDSAVIETSLNGVSWTIAAAFTTTQGLPGSFVQATVPLGALGNLPTAYIRFRYKGTFDWWWAVDNIAISGDFTGYSYAWTSTPAGFTSSLQNPTGVTQTVATTYQVKITGIGGCFATANTPPVGILPAPSATADNISCNNNGTVGNNADDFITFDLNPSGGLGTSYNVSVSAGTITPASAPYGAPTTFTLQNGSAGGGNVTVTITDTAPGSCSSTAVVTDPGPCSTCNLTNAGLSGISCNDNNTSSNPTDDYIVFSLNPTGTNLSLGYSVSVSSGSVSPTMATYGSSTQFTMQPGSAGSGNVTVTITDNLSGACTIQTVVTDPGSCSPQCELTSAGLSGVTCNNNGTNANPADDRIVFTLNPVGFNLGGTGYTVSVSSGSVSPTSGTYGAGTVFTMNPGSAGGGNVTVTITDATNGVSCSIMATVTDPGTCSTNCSLASAGLTGVTCNNNSTSSNPTDDRIVFSLNPTGTNLGTGYSISVSSGSVSPTTGMYGGSTQFTMQPGSAGGGNVTVTITDNVSSSCTIQTIVTDPGSCSTTCALTSAGLSGVTCNNNGTNANPADDRIVFNLNPTGFNLGTSYTVSVSSGSVSPTTGNYGSSTMFTMNTGSAGGGNVTVTITDNTTGACTIMTTVTDPGTCSTNCSLASAGLSGVTCNNNGTPSNPTDDRIVFSLNPMGTNIGTSYTVSVSSGSVSPTSANYGASTQFTMQTGSAGSGNVTVTITDNVSGSCTIQTVVTDPGSCSTTCGLTSAGLSSVTCNDNGTTSNATDDRVVFTLNPTGFNLGTSYTVSVSSGSVSPTTANYGAGTTFTMNAGSAGGGNITVTITDNTTGACTIQTVVTNPGSCSTTCALASAGLTGVTCNDNATPSVTTDDRIVFSLNPTGSNLGSGYTVSVSSGSVSPTTGTYGSATVFTMQSGSAGGGNVVVTIEDNAPSACSITANVTDPGSCSTTCAITGAGLTNVLCNDNSTPTNGTDDRILFSLNPTGSNTGATFNVSVSSGTVAPTSGTFGVTTAFMMNAGSANGGNVTVTIASATNPSCTFQVVVTNPATLYYKDTDNDNYSDGTTLRACAQPTGYKLPGALTALSGDCNDNNAAINPGATEVCNNIDDDCDTQVDEGVQTTFYRDMDGDTYGDPNVTTMACSVPTGFVANNLDCNDNNAAIKPGAPELCNGVDDDCDGLTDELITSISIGNLSGCNNNLTSDPSDDTFTADVTVSFSVIPASGSLVLSGDGSATVPVGSLSGNAYLFTGVVMPADGGPVNLTATFSAAGGCSFTNPNAGMAPASCSGNCFVDITNLVVTNETCAGQANGAITITAIGSGPIGYSINGGQSYEQNNMFTNLAPGAYNVMVTIFSSPTCFDTETATVAAGGTAVTWYKDIDNDGYSDGVTFVSCTQPPGYKLPANLLGLNNDCDDTDQHERPGQTWYRDADNDGYSNGQTLTGCLRPTLYKAAAELSATSGDCNDSNAAIHPNAPELCNGIDDDCDGQIDENATGGTLTYTGNVTLASQAQVDAFSRCYHKIVGNVVIKNASIVNFWNLIEWDTITGNLTIENTGSDSLTGFDNLRHVGGFVKIFNNASLKTLDGFDDLIRVGGQLWIYNNFQLNDCCAIYPLLTATAPLGVGGAIYIYGNQTHCESLPAVLDDCDGITGQPGQVPAIMNWERTEVQRVDVFPNPASTAVTVKIGKQFNNGFIRLLDGLGRVAMLHNLDSGEFLFQFDVEKLPSGTYLVQTIVDGEQFTERLIIE